MKLRQYQEDVIAALHDPGRELVVMATGTGKTVVFASYLERYLKPGMRALVLAHRDELIQQAAEKIAAVSPTLKVQIEKADSRAPRDIGLFAQQRIAVVASVQSLYTKRMHEWDPADFDLVIVDEAHRATADSYVNIFRYFGCLDGKTPLIGFTATPGRSDGKGLGSVFRRIVANLDVATMVDAGWLVPVRAYSVQSGIDLSTVAVRAGDFAQGQLEDAVNDDARNALIVAAYEKYAPGRQAIAFTAGVEHARQLAAEFTSRGISAEPVWGEMPFPQRQATLASYASGQTRVLTNFGVLTEGFDAPNTAAVILARPTKSMLILTQMIGRGTRPHESLAHLLDPDSPERRKQQISVSAKADVLVIDVCDTLSRGACVTTASLADLPTGFDPQGEDVFALRKAMDGLDPRLAAKAKTANDIHRYVEQVAKGLSIVEIDVLAAIQIDPDVQAHSGLTWSRTGADRYAIRVATAAYTLAATTLGTWALEERGQPSLPMGATITDAFAQADELLSHRHPQELILVDRRAAWRQARPSDKQVAKKVFPSPAEVPASLTKGQASQLLDAAFAIKGKR